MSGNNHPFPAQNTTLNRKPIINQSRHSSFNDRPSVNKDGYDKFKFKGDDPKKRYLISGNEQPGQGGSAADLVYVAEPKTDDGTVANSALNNHGKARLAVNPAKHKRLKLPDVNIVEDCVLTWFDPHGAAWMRASDLVLHAGAKDVSGAKLITAADHAAEKMGPKAPDPATQPTTPCVIKRNVSVSGAQDPTVNGKTLYVKPNQTGIANRWGDYLLKKGVVNLCMNLPSAAVAPWRSMF